MKHLRAIVLFAAILLASIITASPASAGGKCSLLVGRTGWYVTVNRGPCYYRDFPTWCNAYVPKVIWQGMKIRCEQKAPGQ